MEIKYKDAVKSFYSTIANVEYNSSYKPLPHKKALIASPGYSYLYSGEDLICLYYDESDHQYESEDFIELKHSDRLESIFSDLQDGSYTGNTVILIDAVCNKSKVLYNSATGDNTAIMQIIEKGRTFENNHTGSKTEDRNKIKEFTLDNSELKGLKLHNQYEADGYSFYEYSSDNKPETISKACIFSENHLIGMITDNGNNDYSIDIWNYEGDKLIERDLLLDGYSIKKYNEYGLLIYTNEYNHNIRNENEYEYIYTDENIPQGWAINAVVKFSEDAISEYKQMIDDHENGIKH